MTSFTKVDIDMRRRHTRWVLSNEERVHAVVMAAVNPKEGHRPLHRIDMTGDGRTVLYIVSDDEPNPYVLARELGPSHTTGYEAFLARLDRGQEWRFRLKANPTTSPDSHEKGVRGAHLPVLDMDGQLEWLERRARINGFHIPTGRLGQPETVILDSSKTTFHRKGHTVTLASMTVRGILAIDDTNKMRSALTHGIGRGKAYGFGLITLLPIGGN